MKHHSTAVLLLLLSVSVLGSTDVKYLDDTSVLSFAVSVGGGPGAEVRRAYVAHDPTGDAIYSIAQVEQGTVSLGGSSLTVSRAGGTAVQSIFVYRLKPGSVSETEWAANLQASATEPQSFFVTAAAASPVNGNLYLIGTFGGVLQLGNFQLSSSGSFDIFVAAVSAADGKVLWANSFGGAVGPDAGYDLAFNPHSGELLASGAFSKNAVFGPGHAAAATVNNVMHSQGIFVAAMDANQGSVSWVSSFPSDAEFINTVKLAVSDGIYLGAAAHGPFTVYVSESQLSIPATGAGAVLFKLGFNGKLDASIPPTAIMSVSNGASAFTLSSLGAAPGALYATCTFVGKLLVGGKPVGHTGGDVYSNAAVIQFGAGLDPVWFTTFGGSGPQILDSLAVAPGNSSIFVSGNAWSNEGVAVATATLTGPTANGTFQAPAGGTKSAFLMQLSATTGTSVWLRLFEGHQEQSTQIMYDASGVGEDRLLVTGLFIRGHSCLELNSRSTTCGDGALPYFLASVPVSPTNTAAVEQELESQDQSGSSLSSGAIIGIIVGSVLGAAIILGAVVLACKRRRQGAGADETPKASGPSWSSPGAAQVVVTISQPRGVKPGEDTPKSPQPEAAAHSCAALSTAPRVPSRAASHARLPLSPEMTISFMEESYIVAAAEEEEEAAAEEVDEQQAAPPRENSFTQIQMEPEEAVGQASEEAVGGPIEEAVAVGEEAVVEVGNGEEAAAAEPAPGQPPQTPSPPPMSPPHSPPPAVPQASPSPPDSPPQSPPQPFTAIELPPSSPSSTTAQPPVSARSARSVGSTQGPLVSDQPPSPAKSFTTRPQPPSPSKSFSGSQPASPTRSLPRSQPSSPSRSLVQQEPWRYLEAAVLDHHGPPAGMIPRNS